MAEEISDDRFKSEVMRLLNTVIVKLGDHDKRFESIDQRFESIDQKFDGLEQRFDGLEQKFDGLEQRFDGLEQRFDGLEQKVDKNTEEILLVKKNLQILSAQFTDVVGMVLEDNKRITKLEKDVEDLQSNIH